MIWASWTLHEQQQMRHDYMRHTKRMPDPMKRTAICMICTVTYKQRYTWCVWVLIWHEQWCELHFIRRLQRLICEIQQSTCDKSDVSNERRMRSFVGTPCHMIGDAHHDGGNSSLYELKIADMVSALFHAMPTTVQTLRTTGECLYTI